MAITDPSTAISTKIGERETRWPRTRAAAARRTRSRPPPRRGPSMECNSSSSIRLLDGPAHVLGLGAGGPGLGGSHPRRRSDPPHHRHGRCGAARPAGRRARSGWSPRAPSPGSNSSSIADSHRGIVHTLLGPEHDGAARPGAGAGEVAARGCRSRRGSRCRLWPDRRCRPPRGSWRPPGPRPGPGAMRPRPRHGWAEAPSSQPGVHQPVPGGQGSTARPPVTTSGTPRRVCGREACTRCPTRPGPTPRAAC